MLHRRSTSVGLSVLSSKSTASIINDILLVLSPCTKPRLLHLRMKAQTKDSSPLPVWPHTMDRTSQTSRTVRQRSAIPAQPCTTFSKEQPVPCREGRTSLPCDKSSTAGQARTNSLQLRVKTVEEGDTHISHARDNSKLFEAFHVMEGSFTCALKNLHVHRKRAYVCLCS